MEPHVQHSKLIPGLKYKLLWRAWTHSDFSKPHTIEELGTFIRHRPDLPDWNKSVLEFQNTDEPRIIRAREIHAFVEYSNYREEAEHRLNRIINGISLKEELMIHCWNPEKSNWLNQVYHDL